MDFKQTNTIPPNQELLLMGAKGLETGVLLYLKYAVKSLSAHLKKCIVISCLTIVVFLLKGGGR